MNLPGAAALPVSLACGDPFTASLSDQPGQHILGEAPAFRLGPRPAHTVIMAALAAPAPPRLAAAELSARRARTVTRP